MTFKPVILWTGILLLGKILSILTAFDDFLGTDNLEMKEQFFGVFLFPKLPREFDCEGAGRFSDVQYSNNKQQQ